MYEGLKSRGVETQLVALPPRTARHRRTQAQLDLLERVTNWYDSHLGRTSKATE